MWYWGQRGEKTLEKDVEIELRVLIGFMDKRMKKEKSKIPVICLALRFKWENGGITGHKLDEEE